jgi:uncharacterized protein with HEPN domain
MNKNVSRLNSILRYCDKIEETMDEFGKDIEDFKDNTIYHDVCSFYISQAGESIKSLPAELTKDYPEIHWKGISGMRDVIAHGYEKINLETVWTFIIEELPALKEACEEILRGLKTPR